MASYINIFPIQAYALASMIRKKIGFCEKEHDVCQYPDRRDRIYLVSTEVKRAVKEELGLTTTHADVRCRVSIATGDRDDGFPVFEVYHAWDVGGPVATWEFPRVPDNLANALKFELLWMFMRPKGKNARHPIPLV